MEWLASIIVGFLSLIGVIFTNNASNTKMSAALEKAQAITDTKLDALTREVREHNGFAQRIPVIENNIKRNEQEIEEIKHELSQIKKGA